jgi:hypothetical protein
MTSVRIDITISNPCFTHSATKIRVADFLQLVQKHLPQTLKRVSVFEDFSDNLAAALQVGNAQLPLSWHQQVDASRIVDFRIGAAFASRSLDLEQLSVSYMVNAEDFFRACLPT